MIERKRRRRIPFGVRGEKYGNTVSISPPEGKMFRDRLGEFSWFILGNYDRELYNLGNFWIVAQDQKN